MTDDQGPAADDDPFLALAQIKARRAMADLAGFPHHPSWDALEVSALARLRLGRDAQAEASPELVDDPVPVSDVEDPMLMLAHLKAFRMAADTVGVAHDPSWDSTEASLGNQLSSTPRSADADESDPEQP